MTRCVILLLAASLLPAQTGWWNTEPIRWVQTNLREVDASMDTHRLVSQLAEMRANVVLMGMGGITRILPDEGRSSTTRVPTCRRATTCLATWSRRRTRAGSAW